MIVVSVTSPIAAIGRLDLLHSLFGTVVIARAVVDPKKAPWLTVRSVKRRNLVAASSADLDAGEAEAIALAADVKADLILMDERRGRRYAARLGLRPLGLLGVLIKAKRDGVVTAVKPILDDLISKAGFWIGS